ncbi:thyrotropin-releasing hormone receptor-like [Amphiura filiformis]|uniref:thyrotropin-releasing hormone receptor-like n=1 Tax=Amphiura filiformis TaxID=82378 RepID=UPI003B226029
MAAIGGEWPECNPYITLNLSHPQAAATFLYSTTENYFFIIGVPILIAVGVLTNSAFIFTVYRVRSMRTITNAYLVNVAAVDLMFVAFGAGLYLSNYYSSPVRFDIIYKTWIGCVGSFGFVYVTYSTSLVLITLVAVERYCAICRPLQLRAVSGKGRTTKLIIASWLLGVLLAACVVPRYSGNDIYCAIWPNNPTFASFPRVIKFCVAGHPDIYIFSEALNVIPFALSMIGNLFMYTHIIITLGRRPSLKQSDGKFDASAQQMNRVRNQVARLLIINGLMFFTTQAPFRVTSIHNMLAHNTGTGLFTKEAYGILLLITRCLVIINSCVNPIVYFLTSSLYRHAFYKAFGFASRDTIKGVEDTKIRTVSRRTYSVNETIT